MDFIENSYRLHANEVIDKSINDMGSFFKEKSANRWRHNRAYNMVTPLIKNNKHSRWLTVGDGRYGFDAYSLKKRGPDLNITASNISDELLAAAHEKGFIQFYLKENAEFLSSKTGEYDYVFCRESFHHFPRPYIALYEFIRAARKAVVLIEPLDIHSDSSFMDHIFVNTRKIIKRIRGQSFDTYEESGNYVYGVSLREIKKICLALDMPALAYLKFNDCFLPNKSKKSEDWLLKKMKLSIAFKDLLSRIGVFKHILSAVIIYNEPPSENEIIDLKAAGYQVELLQRNPFVLRDRVGA